MSPEFGDRNFISTTNHIERYLEEVRRRIKIQGYFKSEKSLNLWIYGIMSQLREQEQQPKQDMPKYIFTPLERPNAMDIYINKVRLTIIAILSNGVYFNQRT